MIAPRSKMLRVLAVVILIVFGWTNIALSVPQDISLPLASASGQSGSLAADAVTNSISPLDKNILNPRLIKIPEELGEVMEVFDPLQPAINSGLVSEDKRTDTQLVVHIRDAHANYEAQVNIKKIIHHLVDVYGFNLVQVEGASSKVDPSIFELSIFKESNAKVADSLLKEGKLTAAEAYAIESDEPVEIYGVEDADLYRANLKAFREVFSYQAETKDFSDKVAIVLTKLVAETLNPNLKALFKSISSYEGKRYDLLEFIESLNSLAEENDIITLGDFSQILMFPNLVRLMRLKEIEDKTNEADLRREKELLIFEIETKALGSENKTYVVEQLESNLQDVVSARDFFKKLEALVGEAAIDMDFYYQIKLYAEHAILREEVDGKVVFEEIEGLKQLLEESFVTNESESRVVQIVKDFIILKKLFRLELSRENLLYYKEHHDNIDIAGFTESLKKLAAENAIESSDIAVTPEIETCFDKVKYFYRFALERDNVFIDNALNKMSDLKKQKSILITGGFHSDGVAQGLTDRKVSYISISPRFKFDEKTDNYLSVMLESPSPYGTVFAGTFSLQAQIVTAVNAMFENPELVSYRDLDAILRVAGITYADLHQMIQTGLIRDYPESVSSIADLPMVEQIERVRLMLNENFARPFINKQMPILVQIDRIYGYPGRVSIDVAVSLPLGPRTARFVTITGTRFENDVPVLGTVALPRDIPISRLQEMFPQTYREYQDVYRAFNLNELWRKAEAGYAGLELPVFAEDFVRTPEYGITPTAISDFFSRIGLPSELSELHEEILLKFYSRMFERITLIIPPDEKLSELPTIIESLVPYGFPLPSIAEALVRTDIIRPIMPININTIDPPRGSDFIDSIDTRVPGFEEALKNAISKLPLVPEKPTIEDLMELRIPEAVPEELVKAYELENPPITPESLPQILPQIMEEPQIENFLREQLPDLPEEEIAHIYTPFRERIIDTVVVPNLVYKYGLPIAAVPSLPFDVIIPRTTPKLPQRPTVPDDERRTPTDVLSQLRFFGDDYLMPTDVEEMPTEEQELVRAASVDPRSVNLAMRKLEGSSLGFGDAVRVIEGINQETGVISSEILEVVTEGDEALSDEMAKFLFTAKKGLSVVLVDVEKIEPLTVQYLRYILNTNKEGASLGIVVRKDVAGAENRETLGRSLGENLARRLGSDKVLVRVVQNDTQAIDALRGLVFDLHKRVRKEHPELQISEQKDFARYVAVVAPEQVLTGVYIYGTNLVALPDRALLERANSEIRQGANIFTIGLGYNIPILLKDVGVITKATLLKQMGPDSDFVIISGGGFYSVSNSAVGAFLALVTQRLRSAFAAARKA